MIRVRSFGFCTGSGCQQSGQRYARCAKCFVEGRRGRAQRDSPPSRCCALHCPTDLETTGQCRDQLAIAAEMTDSALEAALFTAVGTKQRHRRHAEPDWAEIHRELKRKHFTLAILWDESIRFR